MTFLLFEEFQSEGVGLLCSFIHRLLETAENEDKRQANVKLRPVDIKCTYVPKFYFVGN